jgi:hypothetical protein
MSKKLKLKDLSVGDRFKFWGDPEELKLDHIDPEDGGIRVIDSRGNAKWYAGYWEVEERIAS